MPGTPSGNASPARPRRVTSRYIVGPTGLRAFRSVPSGADPRADLLEPHPIVADSAVFLINNGAQFRIGISGRLNPLCLHQPDVERHTQA